MSRSLYFETELHGFRTDFIAQGSSKILASTTGTNAVANGIKAFSISTAHEWVLNIGHFFGHSFKP